MGADTLVLVSNRLNFLYLLVCASHAAQPLSALAGRWTPRLFLSESRRRRSKLMGSCNWWGHCGVRAVTLGGRRSRLLNAKTAMLPSLSWLGNLGSLSRR